MRDHASISVDSEYTVWESKSINREIRLLAITTMFSALAVASSSALVFIPSLETLTVIFFLVGYRYGMRVGVSTAIISTILFEFVASAAWGPSGITFFFKFPPYLFVACLGGFFGYQGEKSEANGLLETDQKGVAEETESWSLLFGIIGIIVSFVFDLITTASFLVWTLDLSPLIFQMIAGLPFTFVHCCSNFIMFFLIPQINKSLDRVDPLMKSQ